MEQIVKNRNIKKKLGVMAIVFGILLIVSGFIYSLFISFKGKDENNNNSGNREIPIGIAEDFEGIYTTANNKMYIHKNDNDELSYVIADLFHGTANIIDENTARANIDSKNNTYFEFKLVNDGIKLEYYSNKKTSFDLETGVYKKIDSKYSKETIYWKEFGNPGYLNLICSGMYVSDSGIELYVIQTSGESMRVISKSNDKFGFSFNEEFDMISENGLKVLSYSDTDKKNIDYEIKLLIRKPDDKEFNLIAYDKANKKFEAKYTYKRAITENEIIEKFYSSY